MRLLALTLILRYFNSIKVRLKLNSMHYDSEAKRNFNSIKVRLKPFFNSYPDSFEVFQFHKGTIKTGSFRKEISQVLLYFNSIKVRLKRIIGKAYGRLFKFQFHKGTIKTEPPKILLKARQISIP